MKKKNVRINPLVAEDLLDIKKYLEEYTPSTAIKTVKELYSKFELIAEFPEMGANLSNRIDFATKYRYYISEDYI